MLLFPEPLDGLTVSQEAEEEIVQLPLAKTEMNWLPASPSTLWVLMAIDGGSTGSTDLVNINTASREQIMTLPGIGEVTADAIIEYREQNPFERIEDIMNVQGIGEAKFNSIRDLICV